MAAVSSLRGERGIFPFFYNTTSTGSNEFMTHQLKSRDIIALGFMTFALFVGAGNIIFPPMVGLQAGEHGGDRLPDHCGGSAGADGGGAGESRRRR